MKVHFKCAKCEKDDQRRAEPGNSVGGRPTFDCICGWSCYWDGKIREFVYFIRAKGALIK